MNIKSKNRISRLIVKKHRAAGLFVQSKYAVLAFISLLLSARLESIQFTALALIFGLKWAFESPKQIIQIIVQEKEKLWN